jgi:peptide/nickel transport system permease protein
MSIEPSGELALETPGEFGSDGPDRGSAGVGPWRIGMRRLRRNKTALAFGLLFVLIAGACLAAPLWAEHVAHTTPEKNHLTDQIKVGGKLKDVVSPDGVPIGPTYQGKFFLGADDNGRDTMVRLLYGGRNSLYIGLIAAMGTAIASVIVALAAGYFRGWVDAVSSGVLDLIWAYPVVLLGIALGTALSLGGLNIGPLHVAGDSKAIPIFIIALVYIPYMARPLRGQVLAMREREFVEAARAQGAGPIRIMFSEILPNLSSTIVVFLPLMIANAILLEAALSFLGAGVRPPDPSWGNMIGDGINHILSGAHQTIVPGLALVLTVLALNVFGDGVRDALDPRSKMKMEAG